MSADFDKVWRKYQPFLRTRAYIDPWHWALSLWVTFWDHEDRGDWAVYFGLSLLCFHLNIEVEYSLWERRKQRRGKRHVA